MKRLLDALAPIARDDRTSVAAWIVIPATVMVVPRDVLMAVMAVEAAVVFLMLLADQYGYDPLLDMESDR